MIDTAKLRGHWHPAHTYDSVLVLQLCDELDKARADLERFPLIEDVMKHYPTLARMEKQHAQVVMDARDLLLILMKMVISPNLVDSSFAAEAYVVISRMRDRSWR